MQPEGTVFLQNFQIAVAGEFSKNRSDFFRREAQNIYKFLSTQTAVFEGVQERAGELGLCGEVRIQQEAGGDSGHVGTVVVSDHNVSPFNFEKLCLKGGLEAKLFAFHFTTDIFQEKNRGREKIIFPFYITNGQNKSECHDFVS